MLEIKKRYSYKGEFLGLDNYKFLEKFYNEKGEIVTMLNKELIILLLLLSTFGMNLYFFAPITSNPLNGTIPVISKSLIKPIVNGINLSKAFKLSLSSTTFMSLLKIYKNF